VKLQVLSSGSRGNATLVRAGETNVLVDAGLTLRELEQRFDAARFSARGLHHIALTHGHLDHARSSGGLAKRTGATLHLAERVMRNRSVARAPRMARLRIGSRVVLERPRAAGSTDPDSAPHGEGPLFQAAPDPAALTMHATQIPHDADPTVAYAFDHGGRRAVILTDMGEPTPRIAQTLGGAHVLVLEFNHCADMLARGPYPPNLKRRIAGRGGHLSNTEAQATLRHLAGPELHTLVLAHLSEKNNTPERALGAAHETLAELGLQHVRVLVASQDEVGEALEV